LEKTPVTRTRPFGVRALSSIAALSLAATGLAVIAASPAAAAPAVVYDSIPEVQPASYPSLPFQAQATWEFGDYVVLGGTNRNITDITISMTSWACETGGWSTGDCETTPGSTFTHPVTMNLYEVDNSDSVPVVGALIASVTNDVAVPYRPSPSTSLDECATVENPTPTTWWDAGRGTCQNGFAFDVHFDFSDEGALVGNDVIVTLAYNTQSYGANPTQDPTGGYNSLNVSINCVAPPTIGTDETAAAMFRDTTFSGSTRGLKESTQTACPPGGQVNGLRMEITADGVPAIDPLDEVTVFERDVKPNETPETYTEWHEGQTSDRSTVFEDGLHLGIGGPSTVIKGTDLTTPESVTANTVTRAQLRQLIERASVDVVSGTVTYQVPIFFGNPLSPTFTTLRSTSLAAGTSSFSQADTWATTRAFGDYTAQETAPLGELIDAVFDAAAAAGGGVVIAGYGVQADSLAVVSSVVWDDTRYTFTQPVIEACTPTVGTPVTNLAQGGWDFSQTRTQGTNVFTEEGLLVSTFGAAGSPDQRKAAGYVDIDIPLSEVGSVELDIAPGFTGVRPSLQLGFDADGDGTRDAYLVGEPWAYGGGDWTSTVNGDWADANFWVTGNVGFGVPSGGGYPSLGTLEQYLTANPDARITEYGYSLGSGVEGSALIRSITVGCVTTPFGFEVETLAPPTTERLAGDGRFETSVEVSQSAFPGGADTVFIATGSGFADALSAAPAAAIEDAPLLLTQQNTLPTSIRNELIRLDPTTVVIVGGTQAVSSSVARAIRNLSIAPTVERISGADRYATSRAIADEYFATATNAFIATGVNFPDALAAGPAAAEVSAPVILVPGTMSRVDAPTLALLDRLNTEQVYIAGGTAVVSGGIASQLDGLPGVNVDRLSGGGRYETAVAINDEIFGTGPLAYLATGLGFADALAGGAAAANQGAPLYITPPDCIPTDVFASITLREPSTLFILGGTAVLSLDVENLVICD
jgi:putative cell wall-binding protein